MGRIETKQLGNQKYQWWHFWRKKRNILDKNRYIIIDQLWVYIIFIRI